MKTPFGYYRLVSGACLLLVMAACTDVTQDSAADSSTETPPNILLIVADDLGFTDIGAFGSEISTPTLDELALGGLRIANMHAGPACQQTRTMLMASTGYARAIENRPRLEGGQRDNLLSLDWAILPELLQEAGYATYMTGKWDLGWDDGYTPATRGFDRSFVQLGAAASFFRELFLVPFTMGYAEDGVRLEIDDLADDFYATDVYTDKMLGYLSEAEEGKPWFAFMAYTAPHWPLQLPDDDWLHKYAGRYEAGYDALREQRFARALELGVVPANSSLEDFAPQAQPWADLSAEEKRKYSRAQEIYAGMVEHLDMSIARIVDQLEENGQLENTIIVFTSDHGGSPGEHGVRSSGVIPGGGPEHPAGRDNRLENFGRINSFVDHGRGFGEAATAPFKYLKGAVDEGGILAAGFVHYPAEVAAGGVSHSFMTMMDILPTFMEVAGTEHPGAGMFNGRQINDILGRSAWPHLTGQVDAVHGDDYSVGWSNGRNGSLIRGDYKIINTAAPGAQGVTDWRLYNLADDPGEHADIAVEHPDRVAEMVAEWEADWR